MGRSDLAREVRSRRARRTQPSGAADAIHERDDARGFGARDAVAIALIALVTRALHLWTSAGRGVYEGLYLDSQYYADLAASIRLGYGVGDRPYLLSPLYPYWLALFADSNGVLRLEAVRVAQALLGCATAVTTGCIAARWLRSSSRGAARAAGWIAGLAAAGYAPLLHLESTLLVSSVQACVLTVAIALSSAAEISVAARPTRAKRCIALALAAGIAFGIAAALHPIALAVGLACAAWPWMRALASHRSRNASSPPEPDRNPASARSIAPRTAAIAIGMALAIAPFTAHNLIAGRDRVLLSAGGGFDFWIGNGEGAHGSFRRPPEYRFTTDPVGRDVASRHAGRELTYSEASSWWRSRTWKEIGADPARAAALYAKKLLLFAHPREIAQLGESFDRARDAVWTLRIPLDARVILVLALFLPLPTRWFGWRTLASAWPLAALGAYGCATAIFFVTGRYRAPIMPVAIAIASAAVVAAATASRIELGRRPAHWLGAMLALAVVSVATHYVFDAPGAPLALRVASGAVEERQRGMQLFEARRYEDAVQAYESSLDLADDPATRTHLANALEVLGRIDEAEAQYRAVVTAHPRDGIAWYELGNLLRRERRDFRGAEEAYRNAVQYSPSFAEAHFNLGAVLLDLDQPADAVAAFEAALQLAAPTANWREAAEDALTMAHARAAELTPEAK